MPWRLLAAMSIYTYSDINIKYDIPTACLCTTILKFCGKWPYINVIFIGISDNVFCQVEGTIDNIAAYFPVDNIAAYFPIAAFSERLLPHSWGPMR